MTVRCKFRCTEIAEREGWSGGPRVLYHAKFLPVGSGSPENEAFFAATPAGGLELATITTMPFKVGEEYYLDISHA